MNCNLVLKTPGWHHPILSWWWEFSKLSFCRNHRMLKNQDDRPCLTTATFDLNLKWTESHISSMYYAGWRNTKIWKWVCQGAWKNQAAKGSFDLQLWFTHLSSSGLRTDHCCVTRTHQGQAIRGHCLQKQNDLHMPQGDTQVKSFLCAPQLLRQTSYARTFQTSKNFTCFWNICNIYKYNVKKAQSYFLFDNASHLT